MHFPVVRLAAMPALFFDGLEADYCQQLASGDRVELAVRGGSAWWIIVALDRAAQGYGRVKMGVLPLWNSQKCVSAAEGASAAMTALLRYERCAFFLLVSARFIIGCDRSLNVA